MKSLGLSPLQSALETKFLKFWWFTIANKEPTHHQQRHIWRITICFGLFTPLAQVTEFRVQASTLFMIHVDKNVM